MQPALLAQCETLLLLANGAPVLARKLLGPLLARPLDGGLVLPDGFPLFGPSKTIRGIVCGIAAAAAGGALLGLGWRIGALGGAAAMAGDLLSSFIKRRLARPPSSRATGLDQLPESVLPLLAWRSVLPLTMLDIVAGTALFLVGEILLSRLLYRAHIREQPF
ncbi:MAG: CDP-archaeol synthase [Rhodospirillales bacterium]|nr:CDP-archaeol synthase [Rhodospirillales bacterium]